MSFDPAWDKIKLPVDTASIAGTYPNLSVKPPTSSGDLTGSYPDPTLIEVLPSSHDPNAQFGSPSQVPVLTVDKKGRVRSISEVPISYPMPQIVTRHVAGYGSVSAAVDWFGKTNVLTQTAPTDSTTPWFVVNVPLFSSVEVGDICVIRLSPIFLVPVRVVLLNAGGSVTVTLYGGEYVVIQKYSNTQYVFRELYTLPSYDESLHGRNGRVTHGFTGDYTGIVSIDRSCASWIPDGVYSAQNVADSRFIGPITHPGNFGFVVFSITPQGAALEIEVSKQPNEPSVPVKWLVPAEGPTRNTFWVVREAGVGVSTPLLYGNLRSVGGYISTDPSTYRRYHECVPYPLMDGARALFFQRYHDGGRYRVIRPYLHNITQPDAIRNQEWITNVPSSDVFATNTIATDPNFHVVRVSRHIFMLIRSAQISMVGTEYRLVITGRWFDTRYTVFDPANAASTEAAFANEFFGSSNLFSVAIPLHVGEYGSNHYGIAGDYASGFGSVQIQAVGVVRGCVQIVFLYRNTDAVPKWRLAVANVPYMITGESTLANAGAIVFEPERAKVHSPYGNPMLINDHALLGYSTCESRAFLLVRVNGTVLRWYSTMTSYLYERVAYNRLIGTPCFTSSGVVGSSFVNVFTDGGNKKMRMYVSTGPALSAPVEDVAMVRYKFMLNPSDYAFPVIS